MLARYSSLLANVTKKQHVDTPQQALDRLVDASVAMERDFRVEWLKDPQWKITGGPFSEYVARYSAGRSDSIFWGYNQSIYDLCKQELLLQMPESNPQALHEAKEVMGIRFIISYEWSMQNGYFRTYSLPGWFAEIGIPKMSVAPLVWLYCNWRRAHGHVDIDSTLPAVANMLDENKCNPNGTGLDLTSVEPADIHAYRGRYLFSYPHMRCESDPSGHLSGFHLLWAYAIYADNKPVAFSFIKDGSPLSFGQQKIHQLG